MTLIYNDGREGHREAKASILATDTTGMTVQFEDRADTTRIRFTDRAWADFITLSVQSAEEVPANFCGTVLEESTGVRFRRPVGSMVWSKV